MKTVVLTDETEKRLPLVTKVMLSILFINVLANSLAQILVNIYLFKISHNIHQIVLFNFMVYLVWLPAFVLAGWLSKKGDRKKGLAFGGVFQMLFYFLILLLGEESQHFIYLLGSVYGIGSGFYWQSANVLTVDFTNEQNRDWFNGVNGILGSLTQMLGPFIAGWIVVILPGYTGYQLIFFLSFLLFFFSILLTHFLPEQKGKWEFVWSQLIVKMRVREWRKLFFAFIGISFRNGVLSFMILLWVYMAVKNEGILGNYSFATTFASVITYYLLGRFGKPNHRWYYLYLGSIGLSLALIGLVFHMDWRMLVIYGFVAAICTPLIEVPFNTITQNTINKLDEGGMNRIELVTSREIGLSIGRIASVGTMVWLYSKDQAANWLGWYMVILVLAGLTPLYFLRGLKSMSELK